MKTIYLSLISLLMVGRLFSQSCLPDGIWLTTQEEIDNFSINYPGCTEILGDLRIGGEWSVNLDITDLNGLGNLTSVGGSLRIEQNGNLTGLSSLANLTFVGGNLIILGNDNLSSLSGLDNITSMVGGLNVSGNNALSSLSGLDNIPSVLGDLSVSYNAILSNLNGLNNITAVGNSIYISYNDALNSLSGLENLSSVGGDLTILGGTSTFTNLSGLDNLSSVGGYVSIFYNEALTSLNGLDNLSTVGGYVQIQSNEALTSLNALGNLTTVGGMEIQYNNTLTNLSGLENISAFGERLKIQSNYALTSLSGLNISGSFGGDLIIGYNDALTSLDVLFNLISVGGNLEISGNDALTSLDDLVNLSSVTGNLEIYYNEAFLSLSGLENLNTVGGRCWISNNYGLTNLSGLENLSAVGGDLWIEYQDALTSLSGMDNLSTVGGQLRIAENDLLPNLSGMDNLSLVGGIEIDDNDLLTSLSGLEIFSSVGGDLKIRYNDALTSLSGLENFSSVGGNLWIGYNGALTSLNELNNLITVGDELGIYGNTLLSSLSGLENLSFIGEGIYIFDNPNLSFCSEPFICNHINQIIPDYIYGNAPGCNNIAEVSNGCLGIAGHIFHPLFYDLNNNTILDNGEPFLPSTNVLINPGDILSSGNAYNGGYQSLENGTYTVAYNQASSPQWQTSAGVSSYTVTLDQNNPGDSIFFGLVPVDFISDVHSSLTSGQMRCNQMVEFCISAHNSGTLPALGVLWLEIDPNIAEVEYQDVPDFTLLPYIFGWTFQNLYPGQTTQRKIWLEIPGPPDFQQGEALNFFTNSLYQDTNGAHETDRFFYQDEVQCALSAGDKFVSPHNPGGDALSDDYLTYTIRFQNTGNADVYDIAIKDTLSEYLDPSTFQLIASSHEAVLSTSLIEGRYLDFTFTNIFLSDSSSNFEASHGYVMYRIRPYPGLPDQTIIQNTASIYFESNLVVTTNTTENTILSSVSTSELPTHQPQIFPNPTTDIVHVHFAKPISGTYELRDMTGKLMAGGALRERMEIDLVGEVQGIFVLLFKSGEGTWVERVVKL